MKRAILLVALSTLSSLQPLSLAYAAQSELCPGESGYYFTNNRKTNPQQGGFVSSGAFVSEGAFIAPTAAVCGSATVEHGVRLMGNAVIKDEAIVSGKVRVMGNAIVGGTAMVSGGSKKPTIVRGYARVMQGEITGGIYGSTQIPKDVQLKQALNVINQSLSAIEFTDFKRPTRQGSKDMVHAHKTGTINFAADCTVQAELREEQDIIYRGTLSRQNTSNANHRVYENKVSGNLKRLKELYVRVNEKGGQVELYGNPSNGLSAAVARHFYRNGQLLSKTGFEEGGRATSLYFGRGSTAVAHVKSWDPAQVKAIFQTLAEHCGFTLYFDWSKG
ncbi:hypothetical protein [Pseudoalteromonas sp. OOF1S-7]|uniref:hypothetical protein n=1 Tax=Pseudoalteromonas sp. OOF1S-7 TaxID=2917757 RepID=UPI001EF5B97A|nr:hypothetical protein [Pseudoalteromonas sp. OOF1S-7]MCG7536763.1 hypothetical protein [Pseudoalteromonas sp. OOF1S-7]